jgi:hypothetical protein
MYGKFERNDLAKSQSHSSIFLSFCATYHHAVAVHLLPADDMNASRRLAVSVLTNEPVYP